MFHSNVTCDVRKIFVAMFEWKMTQQKTKITSKLFKRLYKLFKFAINVNYCNKRHNPCYTLGIQMSSYTPPQFLYHEITLSLFNFCVYVCNVSIMNGKEDIKNVLPEATLAGIENYFPLFSSF